MDHRLNPSKAGPHSSKKLCSAGKAWQNSDWRVNINVSQRPAVELVMIIKTISLPSKWGACRVKLGDLSSHSDRRSESSRGNLAQPDMRC